MVLRLVLLFSSVCFFSTPELWGQTNDALPDSQQVISEIEILKAQNELLKEHNKEIVSTVKWAVGGVITLVAGALVLFALIAGVNFFQYNRRFSEDKSSMKAELEAHIQGQLETATSKLHAQAQENSQNQIETINKKFETYSKDFKSKIQSSEKYIRGEIHQMQLEAKLKDLNNRLEEGYINDYALYIAAEALKLTHTAEYGWVEHSDILGIIRKILARLKEKGLSIDPDNVKALYEQLGRLEKYQEEVTEIKEIVRLIRQP